MTLRKRWVLATERGSTRSHFGKLALEEAVDLS